MNTAQQLTWPEQTPVFVVKIGYFLMAVAFVIALTYTYRWFLAPFWAYMGFTYQDPNAIIFAVAFAGACLPAFLLPTKAEAVGDFVVWIIYFGLYIPCIIVPVIMGKLSDRDCLALVASLVGAFLLISVPLPKKKVETIPAPLISLDKSLFWAMFFVVYGCFYLLIIVTFGAHMRLVGIDDIYAQRAELNSFNESSMLGYAIGFLAGSFNPFLMAVGLTQRRYQFYLLGAAGQIMLFATAASKGVFTSIILLPAFYFLVFSKQPFRLSRVGLGFSGVAVALALVAADIYTAVDSIVQFAFSFIYLRIFAMPGCLMGLYTEFFLTHPFTYYSHVSVMRMFVDYPYPDQLGVVIGWFLSPTGVSTNANASVFATDGMAALGFWGIVLSGALMRGFMALFDASVRPHTLALGCVAIVVVLTSVMNGSVFTSMLTGGGGLLVLMIYFYSRTTDDP